MKRTVTLVFEDATIGKDTEELLYRHADCGVPLRVEVSFGGLLAREMHFEIKAVKEDVKYNPEVQDIRVLMACVEVDVAPRTFVQDISK